ncbi:MAG: hypothetical protein M1821_000095 [Bathelium mastoideum]|nr:MAG: hypothetical protein M1821_000095 [Bathelium mastoideum]
MDRLPDVDLAFTQALPKVELHAHLTGSISRRCLHEIWLQRKASEPDLPLEDPLTAMPPAKVDYDLTRFATQSVLADFEADNVVYLELRTTPRAILTPSPPVGKVEYVDTILSAIKEKNESSTSLHTTLILSVDRRSTLEDALDTVDIAIAKQAQGVVGIDLCGDPSKGSISTLRPAFTKAHAAGLPICVHFGELPFSDSFELEEMLSWQPDRIGHAIYMPEQVKQQVKRRGLGVEMCLSCNVSAKMLPREGGFDEHHFGEWWQESKDGGAILALCVGTKFF